MTRPGRSERNRLQRKQSAAKPELRIVLHISRSFDADQPAIGS